MGSGASNKNKYKAEENRDPPSEAALPPSDKAASAEPKVVSWEGSVDDSEAITVRAPGRSASRDRGPSKVSSAPSTAASGDGELTDRSPSREKSSRHSSKRAATQAAGDASTAQNAATARASVSNRRRSTSCNISSADCPTEELYPDAEFDFIVHGHCGGLRKAAVVELKAGDPPYDFKDCPELDGLRGVCSQCDSLRTVWTITVDDGRKMRVMPPTQKQLDDMEEASKRGRKYPQGFIMYADLAAKIVVDTSFQESYTRQWHDNAHHGGVEPSTDAAELAEELKKRFGKHIGDIPRSRRGSKPTEADPFGGFAVGDKVNFRRSESKRISSKRSSEFSQDAVATVVGAAEGLILVKVEGESDVRRVDATCLKLCKPPRDDVVNVRIGSNGHPRRRSYTAGTT